LGKRALLVGVVPVLRQISEKQANTSTRRQAECSKCLLELKFKKTLAYLTVTVKEEASLPATLK
jgi:hypothetical protein